MSQTLEQRIRQVIKHRIKQQCDGIAKSTNSTCLHTAQVGSIFCSQHRSPDTPKRPNRSIAAQDAEDIVKEIMDAIQST